MSTDTDAVLETFVSYLNEAEETMDPATHIAFLVDMHNAIAQELNPRLVSAAVTVENKAIFHS